MGGLRYTGTRKRGASGAVAGTLEDAEIDAPRADRIAILVREDARDLMQMGQIVNGPRGEQLRKRNCAEGRMAPAAIKVSRLQIQSAQLAKIFLAQAREFIKQLRQGFPLAFALLREAIEGRKGARLAEFENDFRAGQPVRPLTVNEVADNIESAPSAFPFV